MTQVVRQASQDKNANLYFLSSKVEAKLWQETHSYIGHDSGTELGCSQ